MQRVRAPLAIPDLTHSWVLLGFKLRGLQPLNGLPEDFRQSARGLDPRCWCPHQTGARSDYHQMSVLFAAAMFDRSQQLGRSAEGMNE